MIADGFRTLTMRSPFCGQPTTDALPKVPLLISYYYARKELSDDQLQWILSHPHIELLLDSGAFSAKNCGHELSLTDYMDFLFKWGDRMYGYVALDVIGDQFGTDANLREMRLNGLIPIPVHLHCDGQARMDELFDWAPWVALALNRPKGIRGHPPLKASMEFVQRKMIWARGRNVHWLGYIDRKMLNSFTPFSADASTWSNPQKYGSLTLYLGGLRWSKTWTLDRALQERLSLSEVRAIEIAGHTEAEWQNPDKWRSNLLKGIPYSEFVVLNVTCSSWIRYALDVRKTIGTRVFISTTCGRKVLDAFWRSIDLVYGCKLAATYPNK